MAQDLGWDAEGVRHLITFAMFRASWRDDWRGASPTSAEMMTSVTIAELALGGANGGTGQFSIIDWSGYPAGTPKPTGPFRILSGAEYNQARKAANATNAALHRADPAWESVIIHEVHPIKFGGSPTDVSNKIGLSRSQHTQLTTWWSQLQKAILRR